MSLPTYQSSHKIAISIFKYTLLFFILTLLSYPAHSRKEFVIWEEATKALNERRYEDAIELYTRWIKRYPNNPQIYKALTNRGRAFIMIGDLDAAEIDLEQSLRENNRHSPTISALGELRAARKDWNGALAYYKISMELDPGNPTHHIKRSIVYRNKGNIKKALLDIEEAIRLNPKIAIAYFNRGILRNDLDDIDGAITDFTKCIKLMPNYLTAYYKRGLAHERQSNYKKALHDYNIILKRKPNHFGALFSRGLIHARYERYNLAINDLTKAAVTKPKNGAIQYNIGVIMENIGNYDEAAKYFKKACSLNKEFCD